MIVITQSLDTSLAREKIKGGFTEKVERYEFFAEFDYVALLTQDSQNFTNSLSGIVHVPCASQSKHLRWILSRFAYLRWFYFFLHSFLWLIKHRRMIDLLISDNMDSPAPFIFSVLFRVPYVIHYRYDVGYQIKEINRRPVIGMVLLALERFAFKRVRALWVTSPHLASMAKAFGRRERITIIPNWVDFAEIAGNRIDKVPEERSIGPRILFVGRLHRVKQVDLLIRAFLHLHEVDPSIHLYILGDGEERQQVCTLTNSLGLSGNVHFLGFVDRRTVFEMMKQSDVLVLPSKVEGNPRVLIEAMMCETPIVATNAPGIRDIVQHMKSGYLVDHTQPKELAQAIEYILRNKHASANMVKCAHTFVKQNFSKESVLERIRSEVVSLVPKYKKRELRNTRADTKLIFD